MSSYCAENTLVFLKKILLVKILILFDINYKKFLNKIF